MEPKYYLGSRNKFKRKLLQKRKSRQSRKSKVAGFTLLETIIVLVIIGILMSIAATSWLNFWNVQILNNAQQTAHQAIRQAQVQAIRRNSDWQVGFQQTNQFVQWATYAGNGTPTETAWHNFHPGVIIDINETTLRRSGDIYRVEFSYKGHVNGQLGRLTFSSRNSSKNKRCVVVSTLLGALRNAQERSKADGTGRFCY